LSADLGVAVTLDLHPQGYSLFGIVVVESEGHGPAESLKME
jgi:hypothetical protein